MTHRAQRKDDPRTNRFKSRTRQFRRRLQLERLEMRVLLTTIAVDTFDDVIDPNDGVTSLREAVLQANNDPADNRIELRAGTYPLTLNGIGDNGGDLDIRPAGELLLVGVDSEPSVINGGGGADRIIETHTGSVVQLRNLAVTGGRPFDQGGGILNSGTLSIHDSTVEGNRAGFGGGILNAGNLGIHNSSVKGNEGSDGGGILNSGTLSIHDSTVEGNSSGFGGGIHNLGNLGIHHSTIKHNSARDSGGGIQNSGSRAELSIVESEVSYNTSGIRNSSSSVAFGGGGIYQSGQRLTVQRSTISRNTVDLEGEPINGGGGGIAAIRGTTVIEDSTIANNEVINNVGGIGGGGGILINTEFFTVSARIDNSTIALNSTVNDGGGILATLSSSDGGFPGQLELRNTTITGNDANSQGGGIRAEPAFELSASNTILAGNTAFSQNDLFRQGGVTSLTGSIVDPTDWKQILQNDGTQPLLGDHGGPTQTIALIESLSNPAVDTGESSLAPFPSDQRGPGFARISGHVVDVGAFELQQFVALHQTVMVEEGETATNRGTLIGTFSLASSIGQVTNNGDGTWNWSFDTSDGPDDSQTVEITATDSEGETSRISFELIVNNARPFVLAPQSSLSAIEGEVARYSGGIVRDPGNDSVTLNANIGTVVDHGDGTWRWSWPTTDGPDDSTTVVIEATDSDGATSSTDFELTVLNAAPTQPVTPSTNVLRLDEPLTLTFGEYSDPGSDTVTRHIVNWGDSNVEQIDGAPTPGRTLTHRYFQDGTLSVTVELEDEDGRHVVANFPVEVRPNQLPVADAGGPYSVDEGTSVALDGAGSSDPDQPADSLIYQWDLDGDGVYDDATGPRPTFFAADGRLVHTVGLRVTDDFGASSTDTAEVTIHNLPPEITVQSPEVSIDEGLTATNEGRFADRGVDRVTVTADFGIVRDDGVGQWFWSFDAADGPDQSRTVTITATDDDGEASTVQFELIVQNVPPMVTITGHELVDEGAVYTLNLSSSDPGDDTIHTWLIDWGDGSKPQSFAGTVTMATHVYAGRFGEGSHLITATASDEDGSWNSNSLPVKVSNVDPVIESICPERLIVSEGEEFTIQVMVNDPGAFDPVTVDVDWDSDGIWDDRAPVVAGVASLSHVYPDDQAAAYRVRARDDETRLDRANTDRGFVDVLNVAPVIDRIANSSSKSTTRSTDGRVNLKGVFSDPGLSDTHTLVVHWGDGSTSSVPLGNRNTGQNLNAAPGVHRFAASHDYSTGGIFEITAVIHDDDGGISPPATTHTIVQGVGLVDGTLYVIGSHGDDEVELEAFHRRLKVEVEFGSGEELEASWPLSAVNRVVAFLGNGDDEYEGRRLPVRQLLYGEAGDDKLAGGDAADALFGGLGDDNLKAGRGNDLMIGGDGRDKLFGKQGDDLLVGGILKSSASPSELVTQVDRALADWNQRRDAAILDWLGTLLDDKKRDSLKGGPGGDELFGGVGDKLKE